MHLPPLLLCLAALPATPLPEFTPSPHFGEQTRDERFEDSVSIHLNAAGDFDPTRPTLLVLYALPNGNTIPQTIGRQRAEGRDWHFYIQHIGAQVRYLRHGPTSAPASQPAARNLVIGYLEADGRSWPTWRRERADSGPRIARLIDALRARFGPDTTVALACHSGGGAFVLDYLAHVPAVPDWIERIVFLDANYSFDTDLHAAKLIAWLRSDAAHHLGVYAYDDREVTYNGKPIVSATGVNSLPSSPCSVRSGKKTMMMMPMPDATRTETSRTAR